MSRLWLIGVAAAVVCGAIARIACLGAEFWLDEIWSRNLARQAGSPFAVLFATKHDNNHHLNTLYLYFCPDGVWWGWYRLHSLLAGVLSIAVAARAARRWGRTEAVIAAWLVAGCSWLVLASAEARGYALAVLFALIAFDALGSYLQTRSRTSLVVYWAATILGFLSHLTFIHATIGFIIWSMRDFSRERKSSGDEVRQLLLTHGVPGLLVGLFYLVAIRGMDKGGGPPAATVDVLSSLIGRGLGAPPFWMAPLCVIIAAWLFAEGIWRLQREKNDVWLFFVICCVASPGLYLLFRPPYLFERYFLIPLTFALLVLSRALTDLDLFRKSQRPSRGRQRALIGIAASLLLGFVVGNALIVWRFAEAGRGDFRAALAYVVAHEDGVARVRAEAPGGATFRVRQYVVFYAPRLGREIAFAEADEGAEWMLVHRLPDEPPPEDEIDGYRLEESFPSRGPWAWGWFVYRRVP